MKRNVLWLLSTITVVVLLFGYHTSTSGALSAGSGTVVGSPTQPGRASAASGQGGSGSGGGGGDGGNQADGSGSGSGSGGSTATTSTAVTGGVAQTQWGPVQVQLTTKGSTITDVAMLQYPSGNPQDDQINSYALPILIQETLDAQSAQIDMVSGATVTSVGYVQSLQSALDQAGL
ncbi:hypothetical protein GCM10009844_43400 [Nocardioides koreensis]|uniref:FMN-binding domain-containing protein n=1 Tax=Nocardioides koreensis TaxID=433651 RepID=A0ABP5LXR5_9ACTN